MIANWFRSLRRSAQEISHEKQREYALEIIEQLLKSKTEQYEQLQAEIQKLTIVAPLLEDKRR